MPIFLGGSCPGPSKRPCTLAPYHRSVFAVFGSGGKEYARCAAKAEDDIAMARCISGTDAAFDSVDMLILYLINDPSVDMVNDLLKFRFNIECICPKKGRFTARPRCQENIMVPSSICRSSW